MSHLLPDEHVEVVKAKKNVVGISALLVFKFGTA